jgi:hypothetical protein|tara:strand:+ start:1103 stop:1378 length:276 start_codon:yes stop_codon:yes gene_type:complete
MVKTLSPGLQKLKKTNPKVVEKMGFKKGGKVRTSYAGGGDTHVTKDGRTVQKGLYYNINQAKKKGTSKPGKGSVTDKALAQAKKTAFKKTT